MVLLKLVTMCELTILSVICTFMVIVGTISLLMYFKYRDNLKLYILKYLTDVDLKSNLTAEATIHPNYLEINYLFRNKPYTVRVPYDDTKKYIVHKMFLVDNDNTEIDITQQPGVNYLLTHTQLKGKYIKYNFMGNVIVHTNDSVPFVEII